MDYTSQGMTPSWNTNYNKPTNANDFKQSSFNYSDQKHYQTLDKFTKGVIHKQESYKKMNETMQVADR